MQHSVIYFIALQNKNINGIRQLYVRADVKKRRNIELYDAMNKADIEKSNVKGSLEWKGNSFPFFSSFDVSYKKKLIFMLSRHRETFLFFDF